MIALVPLAGRLGRGRTLASAVTLASGAQQRRPGRGALFDTVRKPLPPAQWPVALRRTKGCGGRPVSGPRCGRRAGGSAVAPENPAAAAAAHGGPTRTGTRPARQDRLRRRQGAADRCRRGARGLRFQRDRFTKEYPTYIGVGPKGRVGGFSQPRDLVGTELVASRFGEGSKSRLAACTPRYLGVFPWTKPAFSSTWCAKSGTARLTGRERAHPRHSPRSSAEGFTYDGTPFREVDTASVLRAMAGLLFRFEYQTCATRFTFSHAIPLEETIQ